MLTSIELEDVSSQELSLPVVLTIAGSDSSGGAGIEADLKSLSAHKVFGITCITGITAQNTTGVKSIHKIPKQTLLDILHQNFLDFLYCDNAPLRAIKTGMLTEEAVEALSQHLDILKEKNVKLVVDPVMISTSGSTLCSEEGMKLCVDKVIQLAYLITPNFEEALTLHKLGSETSSWSRENINSIESLVQFCQLLQKCLGCENVLVKGGHLPWNKSTNKPFRSGEDTSNKVILDILYESSTGNTVIFTLNSIASNSTHGTGCTLASSIAARTALLDFTSLQEAVALSIDYVHRGITSIVSLGKGNGPLNHLISTSLGIDNVIKDKETVEIDSVYEYFVTHPKVKENWKLYTQHSFLDQIVLGDLPFNRFLYFLKQDYYYLQNYAQIHALAASVAPEYTQTALEALIIGEVVKEIEHHKLRLEKKYDIVYERDIDIDTELQPGTACVNYCKYLLEISKKQDYLGIKVALAPCLHGYYEAGQYGAQLLSDKGQPQTKDQEKLNVYNLWLSDYTSEWYKTAHIRGKQSLNDLFKSHPVTKMRLEELVDIFNHVTKLEIDFWSEVTSD